MSMRAIKVGTLGIDSGHLIIIDPGMAPSVQEFSSFVFPEKHGVAKELEFPSGVAAITGHGDGDYPIYALYDDEGDYVGLTICFFPEDVDYQFNIIESDPFLQLDPLVNMQCPQCGNEPVIHVGGISGDHWVAFGKREAVDVDTYHCSECEHDWSEV